ncbi:putative uncharacterized protein [Acetobacter sp. CAG:977]|nr:putative uncharacterized protein [Acetobacter sp. CAG:977]
MSQKAQSVKEFVEKIDSTKKANPKDLSSDQDLTIAIMNLISIEEHLVFSGAKTGKTAFYDLIEEIRETRKTLMQRVIPEYEGEVWCISKHLLASSMRLMEVGTKQQSLGHKKEAYKLFDQAYELYCLFWGLNMNMLDAKDLSWIQDDIEKVRELSDKIAKAVPALPDKTADADSEDKTPSQENEKENSEAKGTLSKMKAFVRKAVDCCIE